MKKEANASELSSSQRATRDLTVDFKRIGAITVELFEAYDHYIDMLACIAEPPEVEGVQRAELRLCLHFQELDIVDEINDRKNALNHSLFE